VIVIDASVLIAILEFEPERDAFAETIARADRCVASAVTLLESGMVLRGRRGPSGLVALADLMSESEIEVVAFDAVQVELALTAFARYGKGIHPRARLNLGDCASYALAKALNAPLLYKGSDFASTDVATVI